MSEETLRFDERIGGVLASPRRTFARLAAGDARAGDVAWLLVAWVVARDLPSLIHAVVVGGAPDLLRVVGAHLPDVLGILVAGVVMGLFVPRASDAHRRSFDVAAYAWVPYLSLQLLGSLYYTLRGYPPSELARDVVQIVGVGWGVAVWAIGLLAVRRTP
jgi:hypothetical protein